jgi:hypothetical protein
MRVFKYGYHAVVEKPLDSGGFAQYTDIFTFIFYLFLPAFLVRFCIFNTVLF